MKFTDWLKEAKEWTAAKCSWLPPMIQLDRKTFEDLAADPELTKGEGDCAGHTPVILLELPEKKRRADSRLEAALEIQTIRRSPSRKLGHAAAADSGGYGSE